MPQLPPELHHCLGKSGFHHAIPKIQKASPSTNWVAMLTNASFVHVSLWQVNSLWQISGIWRFC